MFSVSALERLQPGAELVYCCPLQSSVAVLGEISFVFIQ